MAFPVNVDGTWVNSGASYDAGELRRADAAMFSSAGVATGLTVTVDGSDVVTVQPGSVVISGEDAVVGTGVYRAGIASAATGSLAARDATNGRIDLVVFRQLDMDVVPAHATYTSRIEIIAGTPSATPAVPTRPSMAVELARITVPVSGGAAASVDSSQRVTAKAVGIGTADPWHTVGAGGEPAFQNSWAGASGNPVKFRKDTANNLHINGLVTGGTSGTTVFTLGVGYRPTVKQTILQTTNGASGSFAQCDVDTDGTVKVTTKGGSPTVFGVMVTGASLS